MTRATGWEKRGCTSEPPCNTLGKMPQRWPQAFPEGTRGTGEALERVRREGSSGGRRHQPATTGAGTEPEAHGVGIPDRQEYPRRGAAGLPGVERDGKRRGGHDTHCVTRFSREGEEPFSSAPLRPPPGRDLCSAARMERGGDGGEERGAPPCRLRRSARGPRKSPGAGGGICASLFASRAVGKESSSAG